MIHGAFLQANDIRPYVVDKNVRLSRSPYTTLAETPYTITGPANRKHLCADAEDEALCCCQYRTHSFVVVFQVKIRFCA